MSLKLNMPYKIGTCDKSFFKKFMVAKVLFKRRLTEKSKPHCKIIFDSRDKSLSI